MKKAVFLFFNLIFCFFLPQFCSLAQNSSNSSLIINQVMLGQDKKAKNEFIELYNPNLIDIELKNYILKKKSQSGSESLLVSNKNFNGNIKAQGYFLISSPEFCANIACDAVYQNNSSLSANNTIILYDLKKNIIDKVGYGQASDFFQAPAKELLSDQILKRWQVNFQNHNNSLDYKIIEGQITLHNSQGQEINLILNSQINEAGSGNKKTTSKSNYFLNLWEINKSQNNDYISTEGVVTVLPGVLGTQYFYIHFTKGDSVYGLQIYNYQKKFPELKVGDLIKVSGQLSLTKLCSETEKNCAPNSNFYRLKTKEISDIKIISENNKIKPPPSKKINDLSWQEINSLQTISGEITQNKTNQIYLDDGEKEILLEIKKGTQIPSKNLAEGQFFTISGILSYKDSELKLSLINSEHIEGKIMKEDESLGVLLNEDFWQLEKQNDRKKLIKYIIIIILASLAYLFYLKKRK